MTKATEKSPWEKLAEPFGKDQIQWRIDGKVNGQGGEFTARFVPYVDGVTVMRRLDDALGPSGWEVRLGPIQEDAAARETRQGQTAEEVAVRATLTLKGEGVDGKDIEITREAIGSGKDWKAADTDALKRAAQRFGVARHLYETENLWVPCTEKGRPLVDPAKLYAEKFEGGPAVTKPEPVRRPPVQAQQDAAAAPEDAVPEWLKDQKEVEQDAIDNIQGRTAPMCPVCGGGMWDNRTSKRNPKAPDYKCRDRNCDGVIWPAKPGRKAPAPTPAVVDSTDSMAIPF